MSEAYSDWYECFQIQLTSEGLEEEFETMVEGLCRSLSEHYPLGHLFRVVGLGKSDLYDYMWSKKYLKAKEHL